MIAVIHCRVVLLEGVVSRSARSSSGRAKMR